MAALSAISQQTIRVDVAPFDAIEGMKLLHYPTAQNIWQLFGAPIEIPTAEFLTYYLFHRKKIGSPRFRNYRTIGKEIHIAESSLDGCVRFDGVTVHVTSHGRNSLVEISEHVGEAVGLAVVARIHDLTEADWGPIPTYAGKRASPSFDYQIASDLTNFVQVETKGSSVADNRRRDASVRNQYSAIVEKKAKLQRRAISNSDPHPASLRYGTITVLDTRNDGNLTCLLTDPPPNPAEEPPIRFRLIQRMRFIRDWIALMKPRSQLAAALATRVAALENLRDPFELDGVPLMRGNGGRFEGDPRDAEKGRSGFFRDRSIVTDGPTGGNITGFDDANVLFLGIMEELVLLAYAQDFKRILAYSRPSGTVEKTVECVMNRKEFRRLELPDSITLEEGTARDRVRFFLSGPLNYSPFGLVFGALRIPGRGVVPTLR